MFGDNYSFKAGDGITDRLREHKEQQNVYGYPFQSGYLTTVYRGMRPKKYILRSSVYLGHASLQMTMDLYTSVMPKQMETEMDKVSNTLDRILESGDELAEKQFENKVLNDKIVAFRGDSMVV